MGDAAQGSPLGRGSGLAAAAGQRGCRVLPSSRGPWTPMGGCGCWCRVRRFLGTCPGPGGKWVLRHRGAEEAVLSPACPLTIPSWPCRVLPCVYPGCGCADSSPRCLPQGRERPSLSPAPRVLSTHLAGGGVGAGCGWEQDADGSMGRWRWAGDVFLGRWVPAQGCVCGPVGKGRDVSAGRGRGAGAGLGWRLVV